VEGKRWKVPGQRRDRRERNFVAGREGGEQGEREREEGTKVLRKRSCGLQVKERGKEEGQRMVRGEKRERGDREIKAGREGRGREEVLRGKRKNSARE
jgi:hypothetical protein